jgi:hypothetical protein
MLTASRPIAPDRFDRNPEMRMPRTGRLRRKPHATRGGQPDGSWLDWNGVELRLRGDDGGIVGSATPTDALVAWSGRELEEEDLEALRDA